MQRRVLVPRKGKRRLDVRLLLGSLTDVDAPAYVLGAFHDVAPSGAARAVDVALDGAIAEFTNRRMLSNAVGEIFMVPVGRHPLRADFVVIAGLGDFDRFSDETLRVAAENVVRTLVRTQVDALATVLVGAGAGRDVAASVASLMAGFAGGLRDADPAHRFREVTICELDPSRYATLREALIREAGLPAFQDLEIEIEELAPATPVAPPAPEPRAPRAKRGADAAAPRLDPVYFLVRMDDEGARGLAFRGSVLGAGAKATVVGGEKRVAAKALDAHLAKLESRSLAPKALDAFGQALAKLVVPDAISEVLQASRDRHLVVVHDAGASRVPWETLRLGAWSPAAAAGLSRRYLAEDLSVAKWLEERRLGPVLDVLLVVNPTGDLEGAEREGERLKEIFQSTVAVRVHEIAREKATKAALLAAFRSGRYDVVHYAGHAFFDAEHPARSGVLCHGRDVLSGADLAGVGSLPSLVFFNACEAGRVRGGAEKKRADLAVARRLERSVGLAEAFLRGGVASYVGTYWPVGDEPAAAFAQTFYRALVRGQSIGDALAAGRSAVRDLRSIDWADYLLYGTPEFVLKRPSPP